MNFQTICWRDNAIILLDQTKLPQEKIDCVCNTVEELHAAIRALVTRGAPLLGITAAYGLCLGVNDIVTESHDVFYAKMKDVADYIRSSRPTAVNLFWALERMIAVAEHNRTLPIESIKNRLLEEALIIHNEDKDLCQKIGEHGATLINDGDVLLTHCNAGALATGGIGTALAPMYIAQQNGMQFKVYADETRPLLQGSRLTAWELAQRGIDVTVICDNMAACLMRQGKISKIITGADRIASNGDAANKIGTYSVAVNAKHHNVPFYIAAPYSTFDFECANGNDIPIEERDAEELKFFGLKQIAPMEVNTYNPAFDVTAHELITGFITEKGIFTPPYCETLSAMQERK